MSNEQLLRTALALALADDDFMGNNKKVNKAIEALTPKDTVTSVFKRIQGNALKDFLVKKEEGKQGYSDDTKADKIREYVADKFKSYIEDPKTSKKAKELFDAAYPGANDGADKLLGDRDAA